MVRSDHRRRLRTHASTLADGSSHPFFAVPAGDGAGIYDVEVMGDGRGVGLAAYDLTRVFNDYGVEGSVLNRVPRVNAAPGG